MVTARYENASTKRTRMSALAAFERYLEKNSLTLGIVEEMIKRGNGAAAFERVMDRFAVHLSESGGARGHLLSQGTALLYFGSVKNYFYDVDPTLQQTSERRMKKIASCTDKFFQSKGPTFVKQAPPCTRQDLSMMVKTLYAGSSSEDEYWDAATIVLMWHLFGRSSDMVSLSKLSFSVHPGGALNVRIGRMKTSLEQGISLFASLDLVTCPVHAIAVASVCDIVPSIQLLRQLPKMDAAECRADDPDEIPLVDFLQDHIVVTAASKAGMKARASPGIHAYVNRLLKRVEVASPTQGLSRGLSSHSFRRGGAQAANATPKLSLQWILDRGGWQLSNTNKAFLYIFNSTREDQQVAKVLSGWDPDSTPWTPSLHELDSSVLPAVRIFMANAFQLASTPDVDNFSFRHDVLEMLTAAMIYHYPDMVKTQSQSLYQRRVRSALTAGGYTETDMMAWSLALRHARLSLSATTVVASPANVGVDTTVEKSLREMMQDQLDLMNAFVAHNKALTERVALLERQVFAADARHSRVDVQDCHQEEEYAAAARGVNGKVRQRNAKKDIGDVWYMWYAPRPLWENKSSVTKQRFSEFRFLVAYMRIFVGDTYVLRPGDADYAATVMRVGAIGKAAVLQFLSSHGSTAVAVGTAVKALKQFDATGALDARKKLFMSRISSNTIVDPSPAVHLTPWDD